MESKECWKEVRAIEPWKQSFATNLQKMYKYLAVCRQLTALLVLSEQVYGTEYHPYLINGSLTRLVTSHFACTKFYHGISLSYTIDSIFQLTLCINQLLNKFRIEHPSQIIQSNYVVLASHVASSRNIISRLHWSDIVKGQVPMQRSVDFINCITIL